MRIVASACLVLVILFMVGCGASAEDKKAITDNTAAITALQKNFTDMQKMATDMGAKVGMIETFLKDGKSKFGTYGMPPDTTKKTPEVGKPAPKATTPKTGTTTAPKTKVPGTTK